MTDTCDPVLAVALKRMRLLAVSLIPPSMYIRSAGRVPGGHRWYRQSPGGAGAFPKGVIKEAAAQGITVEQLQVISRRRRMYWA